MSRIKHFARNLWSSYLQLGLNVVYSLISIPLILHWLPKSEFGLWVLLVQLMGYFGLVDLGMTSAVARLLVDHKDDRTTGQYGSLLKAAFLVSLTQGILILIIVFFGAPWVATMVKIPHEYVHIFVFIMRLQGVIEALKFTIRPLNLMLFAYQRMDLQTYNEIFNLVVTFGILLLFLINGFGIYSFVYANAIMVLTGPLYLLWNCWRLSFFPSRGQWGGISIPLFGQVFGYGFQIFLFNLGCQLQSASQTIVISRALGLDSAAIWAVGSKMYNLLFPLMTRPYGAALPGLYEMSARGEEVRLQRQFQIIVQLTAALGAYLAGSYWLCNGLFVGIWTSGKIFWPMVNDSILAIMLFVISQQTTHCTFVSITKKYGAMSYVLLAEGCTFIFLAITVGKYGGIAGIIACSVCCTLVFSYQYSVRRTASYFQCRLKNIAIDWVKPALTLAVVYGLVVVCISISTISLKPFYRLIIHVFFVVTAGLILFIRFGIPRELLVKVQSKIPNYAFKLLSRIVRSEA